MLLTEDDLHDLLTDKLEACGKALGFTLAAMLTEKRTLSGADLAAFALALENMLDAEQFTSDVGFVMRGVADGIGAKLRARPPTDWLAPDKLV